MKMAGSVAVACEDDTDRRNTRRHRGDSEESRRCCCVSTYGTGEHNTTQHGDSISVFNAQGESREPSGKMRGEAKGGSEGGVGEGQCRGEMARRKVDAGRVVAAAALLAHAAAAALRRRESGDTQSVDTSAMRRGDSPPPTVFHAAVLCGSAPAANGEPARAARSHCTPHASKAHNACTPTR